MANMDFVALRVSVVCFICACLAACASWLWSTSSAVSTSRSKVCRSSLMKSSGMAEVDQEGCREHRLGVDESPRRGSLVSFEAAGVDSWIGW